MKKILTVVLTCSFAVVLLGTLPSCANSKATTGNGNTANLSNAPGIYQSLADYLRRHPSVRVLGSGEDVKIVLRTADSILDDIEPLYIVDGTAIGTSYADANRTVDVNDIRSVQVLNMLEATSAYGIRGSNGAVVIKTKTGR